MNGKTIGDLYGPAMEIIDQAEADRYFGELVSHVQQASGKSLDEVGDMVKSNLGYYAGYYDHDTRLRVERLFCCQHPVFGAAAKSEPTPEEAFEAGWRLGEYRQRAKHETEFNEDREVTAGVVMRKDLIAAGLLKEK